MGQRTSLIPPEQLDFFVPDALAEDIRALIAAYERNDPNIDGYMENVLGAARMLPEDQDDFVARYYVLDRM